MVCKLYFNKPALKKFIRHIDNRQTCVLEMNSGRKCVALMGVGKSQEQRELNAYGRAPVIIEQRKYMSFDVPQALI